MNTNAPVEPQESWRKSTDDLVKWLGRAVTALAIFAWLAEDQGLDLSRVFHTVIDLYEAAIDGLFSLLRLNHLASLAVAYLGEVLDISLTLNEQWRHAFTIMTLYFLVDLKISYLGRRITWPATFTTLVFGLSIALIFGAASGIALASEGGALNITLPVIGFALYEAAKAPITAKFVRIHNTTWWQTYWYYTLVYGGLNLVLGHAATRIFQMPQLQSVAGSGASLFILFLLLICLRNFVVSPLKAIWRPLPGLTTMQQTRNSGATRNAQGTLLVLAICLLYLVGDSALSQFSL